MLTIIMQVFGALSFLSTALIFGAILKRNPVKNNVNRLCKIVHLLFLSGLIFPAVLGTFYPGLKHFDDLLGIVPLPFKTVACILGVALFVVGIYLNIISNKTLDLDGGGLPGFYFFKYIVKANIYKKMRNPMSLGLYLIFISFSLMSGSTYLTLSSLLLVIPAHILHLKYFEEVELEIRYDQSYLQYKEKTPFLIPSLFITKKVIDSKSSI